MADTVDQGLAQEIIQALLLAAVGLGLTMNGIKTIYQMWPRVAEYINRQVNEAMPEVKRERGH